MTAWPLIKTEPFALDRMEEAARHIRWRVIRMSHRGRAAHLGSALSCVDILTAAYWGAMDIDPAFPDSPDRDRLILSKGHAATALYATLAQRGFFDPARLDDFGAPGCKLEEHPGPYCAPGVEAATGALGHGLPIGLGIALAGRIQRQDYRVYVVLGDGECNEGSVWEAAMLAPALGLDNLMAVVDFNRWQATGRSCSITALAPLAAKWRAFGWNACEVDGHDLGALSQAMSNLPDDSGRPCAVVAHTTKGKGVSFMEDDNNWHYRIPNADEAERARKELGL